MKLFRTLLILCSLCALLGASRAAPLDLDQLPPGQPLAATGHLLWFTDESAQLTLDDVRAAAHAGEFQPADYPTPRGTDGHAHWFKITLHQSQPTGDWLLTTHTTALKDVQFYGPFDAQGRALAEPVHTGLTQPYATRQLASERYVMRLELQGPATYTVYARLVGDIGSALDLSIWDTAEFLQWRQHKRLFDGLCYGFLLALLVYNLALAGIFRDASYVFYIGQCASALLTLASFNGHAAHYLWGHWPWWQERANVVLPCLWVVMNVQFTRNFLGLRQAPRLNGTMHALALLAMVAGGVGLAGQFGAAQAGMEVLSITSALASALAALVMLRRGFRPARWYLSGQLLLFFCVILVVAVNWGLVESPFLLANGLQIGLAAEMVVFAIALSSRINRLQASQTALRLHADHLAQVAATDALTGLANRHGLVQGAARILTTGAPRALMLLDLDRFKPINDVHGHDAGDDVLRTVAQRLRASVRADDVVARLGGDEFVVLLAQTAGDDELAALAQRLVQAVRQPMSYQGQRLRVGVSVGIARLPQDGQTLESLMRSADQAMYHAKHARGGYAFCTDARPPQDALLPAATPP